MSEPEKKFWLDMLLAPTGSGSGDVLSPNLMAGLLSRGVLQEDDLLAAIPCEGRKTILPWSWEEEDSHRRGARRPKDLVMPVWAQWVLRLNMQDVATAVNLLIDIVPPSHWARPLWNKHNLLDYLSENGADKPLGRLLDRMDDTILADLKARPARRDNMSINDQTSPGVIRLLAKHGWDVNQKNEKGRMAIEGVRDISSFEALLDCGADTSQATERIRHIESAAAGRQRLLMLVNEKKQKNLPNARLPAWTKPQNEVAFILESGSSGGFLNKLEKLGKEHPKAPQGGLEVEGGSAGHGMLNMALRSRSNGRLKQRLKSYLILCEAMLRENGKGWIDLDQPARGSLAISGMLDQDAMGLGLLALLTHEHRQARWTWRDDTSYPPSVGTWLSQWIPKRMSQALADMAQMGHEAIDPSNIIGALALLEPAQKGMPSSIVPKELARWWTNIESEDPAMVMLRELPGFSVQDPKGLFDDDDYDDAPAHVKPSMLPMWPNWLVEKLTEKHANGSLTAAWIDAAAAQWRSDSFRFLASSERGGPQSAVEHAKEVEWSLEQDSLLRNPQAWEQWGHAIFDVPVALHELRNSLLTDHERELVVIQKSLEGKDDSEEEAEEASEEMKQEAAQATLTLSELLKSTRYDPDDFEDCRVLIDNIRRVRLQTVVLESGNLNADPGAIGKLKL
jgi:hypothetical protein